VSLTEPHSAPPGEHTRANSDADGKTIAEGAGAFIGGASGASIGIVGGPIGLVIGAIAGAVGGWWAGKGIANAINADDDLAFRRDYEGGVRRLADRTYEEVRPAYIAGHLAAVNPEYHDRSFDEIENDLERGWKSNVAPRYGAWPTVRSYARSAFERTRRSQSESSE
jgi:hypothetical protein